MPFDCSSTIRWNRDISFLMAHPCYVLCMPCSEHCCLLLHSTDTSCAIAIHSDASSFMCLQTVCKWHWSLLSLGLKPTLKCIFLKDGDTNFKRHVHAYSIRIWAPSVHCSWVPKSCSSSIFRCSGISLMVTSITAVGTDIRAPVIPRQDNLSNLLSSVWWFYV